MAIQVKSVVLGSITLLMGGIAGGIGALLWYDPHFKVPYEASSVCYAAIGERLDNQVRPREISGGKREYGWEHWVGLYDGPGPDFSNRKLLGVAHCKIINEYNVSTGRMNPRVIELQTSFDGLLRNR